MTSSERSTKRFPPGTTTRLAFSAAQASPLRHITHCQNFVPRFLEVFARPGRSLSISASASASTTFDSNAASTVDGSRARTSLKSSRPGAGRPSISPGARAASARPAVYAVSDLRAGLPALADTAALSTAGGELALSDGHAPRTHNATEAVLFANMALVA